MLIEITGFQSIKNKITVLLEKLTVISGESNGGKSAIVRAIKAAVSNRLGTEFINVHCDESSVLLKTDKHQLEWTKKGSETTYIVDGAIYSKPGRGAVPDPVRAIGIEEIRTVDRRRFWPQIQSQLELPFILGESSPAIVAELLGSNQEANQVAKSLKIAQSELNQEKSYESVLEKQLAELTAQIDKVIVFSDVVTTSHNNIKDRELLCASIQTKITHYEKLISNYQSYFKIAKKTLPLLNQKISQSPDLTALEKIHSLFYKYEKTEQLIQKTKISETIPAEIDRQRFQLLSDCYIKFTQVQKKLQTSENLAPIKLVDSFDITSFVQRINKLKQLYNDYQARLKSVDKLSDSIQELHAEIKKIEKDKKKFTDLLQDITQCPLCHSPIPENLFQGESF